MLTPTAIFAVGATNAILAILAVGARRAAGATIAICAFGAILEGIKQLLCDISTEQRDARPVAVGVGKPVRIKIVSHFSCSLPFYTQMTLFSSLNCAHCNPCR